MNKQKEDWVWIKVIMGSVADIAESLVGVDDNDECVEDSEKWIVVGFCHSANLRFFAIRRRRDWSDEDDWNHTGELVIIDRLTSRMLFKANYEENQEISSSFPPVCGTLGVYNASFNDDESAVVATVSHEYDLCVKKYYENGWHDQVGDNGKHRITFHLPLPFDYEKNLHVKFPKHLQMVVEMLFLMRNRKDCVFSKLSKDCVFIIARHAVSW